MTKNPVLQLLLLLCMLTSQLVHAQHTYLYVSDAGNFNLPPWQILRFNADGTDGIVFIDDHLDWPQDMIFLEEDNIVLVSNLNSGEIVRFNATTGEYIDVFADGIGGPTRMKIGADGYLYVLQWEGTGEVLRFGLDGTALGKFTASGVGSSIGIDWDASGNLYVSSYYDKIVKKFGPNGADLGTFVSTNLAGPTNIWFDANGDLLVNDYNAGSVKRFSATGTFKGVFIAGVPQCEGIDFFPDGDIVIGVGGLSAVRAYDSTATTMRTIIPSGTLDLLTPNAVILRTINTTSVKSAVEFVEQKIVRPSIGKTFYLDPSMMPDRNLPAVISDASGAFVQKWTPSDSARWDASDLPDGLYYISLPIHGTLYARQTIIIQH